MAHAISIERVQDSEIAKLGRSFQNSIANMQL